MGIFGLGRLPGLCVRLTAPRAGVVGHDHRAYALKAVAIGLPLLWVGFAGHALSAL